MSHSNEVPNKESVAFRYMSHSDTNFDGEIETFHYMSHSDGVPDGKPECTPSVPSQASYQHFGEE
jgi:hypothetical protein